jgi:hypothetical protein
MKFQFNYPYEVNSRFSIMINRGLIKGKDIITKARMAVRFVLIHDLKLHSQLGLDAENLCCNVER